MNEFKLWGYLYFLMSILGLLSLFGYVNPLIGLFCLMVISVINSLKYIYH